MVKEGIAGVLACAGQFHSVRARFDPLGEAFLAVAAIQDFELVVQLGDHRHGDVELGDVRLDDRYFVKTNDLALAKVWLDEDSRAAMLAHLDPRAAHWRLALRRDELVIARNGITLAHELVPGLLLAGTIASAPARWAARLAEVAKLTGAHVQHVDARVALEDPALVLEVDRIEVRVTFGRSGPLAKGGEVLSTRVTAHRETPTSEVWCVVDPSLPRPELPERWTAKRAPGALGFLRTAAARGTAVPYDALEPLALHARGRLRGVIAGEQEATVWFCGAELDAASLGLATQLVVGLVREAPRGDGVYR